MSSLVSVVMASLCFPIQCKWGMYAIATNCSAGCSLHTDHCSWYADVCSVTVVIVIVVHYYTCVAAV